MSRNYRTDVSSPLFFRKFVWKEQLMVQTPLGTGIMNT